MDSLVRGVVILGILIVFIAGSFFLYANFLVDYSLESLELALDVTEMDPLDSSPIEHSVYRGIVEDLVFDETAQEDFNVKNMAFLALASRSMGEASARAGYDRARVYLSQVVESKHGERGLTIEILDSLYNLVYGIYQSMKAFIEYGWNRVFPSAPEVEEVVPMSSMILLIEAQEKEELGLFAEAADLYRKYLELYPSGADRGFVAIALSRALIRQRKYHEAKTFLERTQFDFTGSNEGVIATRLLRRVNLIKDRELLIVQLQGLLTTQEGTPQEELLRLKLAIAYFATYQFTNAEGLLLSLRGSSDPDIQQKAKIYLAAIFKASKQLRESSEVLEDLLDDPNLEKELGLGLRAQLADIYYQQRDVQQALEQYQALSNELGEDFLRQAVSFQAWAALAELEQANIYYFDLDDPEEANFHLERAGSLFGQVGLADRIRQDFEEKGRFDLRKQAFWALRRGKIHWAHDLFKKHLVFQPDDAWAHSGLATVFILFADLEQAESYALQGHDFEADEYTSSVLAYLYGLLEKHEEAVTLYHEALSVNPDYVAARFNIACMYLKLDLFEKAYGFLDKLNRDFETAESQYMRSKILNNLGYALWWMGDRDQAVSHFKKALSLTPAFTVAKKNLAQVALGETPQMVAPSGIE